MTWSRWCRKGTEPEWSETTTRLTQEHDAYRWIGGGVQVNYHAVADFRSRQGDVLDDLLRDNLASLTVVGVVKLQAAAQDGVCVRASAGSIPTPARNLD